MEADVVVIGSGMGGLAAARMLAQFGGKRVLVLEQHYTLGGMTHEFSRAGRYRFGTGLHYISGDAGPFLGFMTDGRVQLQPLPDDYDVLHFPGWDFAVPAMRENFAARLTEEFPAESGAIDDYLRTVRRAMAGLATRNVLAALPSPVRRMGLPIVERLFPETFRTLADQVARSVSDPRLREILTARWGLYGTPPERSAFGYHAAVPTTFFMDGTAHPIGGPHEVNRIVIEILRRHGVELRARQLVERITSDRGRVTGVRVLDQATGERYRVAASTVVGAGGVRNTYTLAGLPLPDLPVEPSAMMLFLGMSRSPAEFGMRGENHWFMDGDRTLYVSFPSLNNPAARFHTVEVLELVDPAMVDRWRGADPPTDGYLRMKAGLTERLLDRLERQWPGFRETVAFAELATPLTFENFQHSVRGSFYGLAATPQRLRSPVAGPRTPLKGLVIAGQDAWGSGVVGALAGGLMAAQALLPGRRAGTMWRTVRAPVPAPVGPWQGYLRMTAVDDVTPAIRRFRLEPMTGGTLPFTFTAGQYLNLELPVAAEPIERSYSISSGPGTTTHVEIAVKREPDGLGSAYLHDESRLGQALRVSGPHGDFTWEPADDTGTGTLLLIAGGVGITPLLSVLAAAHGTGRAVLLASGRDEQVPFRADLDRLGAEVVYLRTGPGGRSRINIEDLRPYAKDAARVHLCGPTAMMRDVLGLLSDLGVPRDVIHLEAFVTGRGRRTRREKAHAIEVAAGRAGVREYTLREGPTVFACPPGRTVLDAANAADLGFPQSCGEGVCGTCRVRIVDGPYETAAEGTFSAAEWDAGWRLACQTLPTGDMSVARG